MKCVFQKNKVVGFLFCVMSFLLFLALITHNPKDPSFLHSITTKDVSNVLGYLGAEVSAFFLYFFGGSIFFLSLLFFWLGLKLVKSASLKEDWDQLFFFIIDLLCVSCLSAYYSLEIKDILPGGLVGQSCSAFLCTQANAHLYIGFLFIFLVASFFVFTRISFLSVAHFIAHIKWQRYISTSFNYIVIFLRYGTRKCISMVKKIFNSKETENIISEDDLIWGALEALEAPIDDAYILQDPFWENFQQKKEHSDFTDEKLNESMTNVHAKEKNVISKKGSQQKEIYRVPPISLLNPIQEKSDNDHNEEFKMRAHIVEEKLGHFGVSGKVISITPGPIVTLFEFQPDINIKVSRILALEHDLALALKALSLRIIAPIPGKSVVGFEVANEVRQTLYLAPLIKSQVFSKHNGYVPIILGHNTVGMPVIIDVAAAPHLLIAGSTGSGKSVALNVMLTSMLYKKSPEDLKLILIDPKRLEFAAYCEIPHLLCPIITHSSKVIVVLKWVLKTMEERYEFMAEIGVKNIIDYKELCKNDATLEDMPFIVVVIDELADLMLVAGGDIEALLARIAQMARAAGIHLIVATQRPSVDVITGVVKVNFPSRVAFKVASKIDSRTILDAQGAEKLLGKGDMLYLAPDGSLVRLHGAYISSLEVIRVVRYVKAEGLPKYSIDLDEDSEKNEERFEDVLYEEVLSYVKNVDQVSISQVQRVFRIGYNRSARIINMLEQDKIISPPDGSKLRKVIR